MKINKSISKVAMAIIFVVSFFVGNASVDAASAKTKANLNLRVSASATSAVYNTIPIGTKIDITTVVAGDATNCSGGKWGKTSYGGHVGYVCEYYVVYDTVVPSPTPTPDPTPTVSPGPYGEVNVKGTIYYGPSTSYRTSYTLYTSHNDPAFYINKYVNDEKMNGSCPSNKWAHVTYIRINYQVVYGFICTSYVKTASKLPLALNPYKELITSNAMSKYTDEQFEAYLNAEGFPEAYKAPLRIIHKQHPSWIFKAVKAPYTFNYSVSQEDDPNASRSLIYKNGSNDGYLSTSETSYNWYTNQFFQKDAGGFYNANSGTIAYYMNPLNFLDQRYIFYFEGTKFYPDVHKLEGVQTILSGTTMFNYATNYMEAATASGISPLFLAVLSRQELGSGGVAINGSAVAPAACGGVNYSGFYNFFNIGATSGDCAVYRGLEYARQKNWNSPKAALVGGAQWILNNYGTKTPYTQKWDLNNFWKQYMQNISAQIVPASNTYDSYYVPGLLEAEKVFEIPVFSDLTAKSSLPHPGNPNNYLNALTVDGQTVPAFDGAKTNYTVEVPYNTTSVRVLGSPVTSLASVSGTGTFAINGDSTNITVNVKAQNGTVRTYTITIKRLPQVIAPEPELPEEPVTPSDPTPSDPTVPVISASETVTKAGYKIKNTSVNGFLFGTSIGSVEQKLKAQNPVATIQIVSRNKISILATGDSIIIDNGSEKITYSVIIFGDTNGDGQINMIDLLRLQKHFTKVTSLTSHYLAAADANRDGKLDMIDLLRMQKQILGLSNITQN